MQAARARRSSRPRALSPCGVPPSSSSASPARPLSTAGLKRGATLARLRMPAPVRVATCDEAEYHVLVVARLSLFHTHTHTHTHTLSLSLCKCIQRACRPLLRHVFPLQGLWKTGSLASPPRSCATPSPRRHSFRTVTRVCVRARDPSAVSLSVCQLLWADVCERVNVFASVCLCVSAAVRGRVCLCVCQRTTLSCV